MAACFHAAVVTLAESVLDAVLEGCHFGVILQSSVRQPGYSLCELLPYFVGQVDHCFWIL